MADNVTADPGAGGATFRTDDDGTAHWPYVKLAWGADNTQTILDSGASAIPIQDGGNTITVDGTVAVTNAGLTELAAAINASSQMDVNIAAQAGALTVASHAVTNAGTFAVQESGGALTALQLIDDAIFADDAAFVQGTSRLVAIGMIADETSSDTIQEHDVGVPRMTLDRRQIVVPQPYTTGGLDTFRSLDLDETEEDVKTTAGCVYGMWVTNTATSTRWIKFYNDTAANVAVGTTTPKITIGIPGNTSDDISGNFGPGGMGITFDTAICVAATTGVADSDTGAPGANEVIVNIFYS